MPRHPRLDSPGTTFHVGNRGAARRTVFETRRDFRFFLSRLAHAVRRGEIEVLAYSLLMTHFHLLVRSRGQLSTGVGRAENDYVRAFNRSRRRDGSLFRGRFFSKPVDTWGYFVNVYRYIDENPVQARLAARPEEWPWGSASRLAAGRPGPWLSTQARDMVGACYGPGVALPDPTVRRARAALVSARLCSDPTGDDPLDELLSTVPGAVRSWMLRKARLADGTAPGVPVAAPQQVLTRVEGVATGDPAASIRLPSGRVRQPVPLVLTVGLLRDLTAGSYADIAVRVDRCPATVRSLYALHRRSVCTVAEYAALAEAVAEAILAPLRVGLPPPSPRWNGGGLAGDASRGFGLDGAR